MTQNVTAGPSRQVLTVLVLGVALLHALMLTGLDSPLTLRLQTGAAPAVMHMRMAAPMPPAPPAPSPPRPKPRASMSQGAPAPAASTETLPSAPTEPQNQVPNEPVVLSQNEPVSASAEPAAIQPLPEPATAAASTPSPETPSASIAASAWSLIPLGALPPSAVLNYQLTGMDKGLTYHASGELRWQHNSTDYELTLAVRAFLVGRRQWRSTGRIEAIGLAPVRFSDSWRNERAAHFDRSQQKIVFSSNSTPAMLTPGAQDQVSLYVQLAAAMAGEPERFAPGTRLQVQTATVRDAEPWSLVLEGADTLVVEGKPLQTAKWVCQPRNRFEARVEFWVAPTHAWMPVRIRITQASGSFIDLLWRSTEPLPALPVGVDTTGSPRGS